MPPWRHDPNNKRAGREREWGEKREREKEREREGEKERGRRRREREREKERERKRGRKREREREEREGEKRKREREREREGERERERQWLCACVSVFRLFPFWERRVETVHTKQSKAKQSNTEAMEGDDDGGLGLEQRPVGQGFKKRSKKKKKKLVVGSDGKTTAVATRSTPAASDSGDGAGSKKKSLSGSSAKKQRPKVKQLLSFNEDEEADTHFVIKKDKKKNKHVSDVPMDKPVSSASPAFQSTYSSEDLKRLRAKYASIQRGRRACVRACVRVQVCFVQKQKYQPCFVPIDRHLFLCCLCCAVNRLLLGLFAARKQTPLFLPHRLTVLHKLLMAVSSTALRSRPA